MVVEATIEAGRPPEPVIRAAARDPIERRWMGEKGEWRATVDRLAGKCGACTPGRWLHITTPAGTRFTFRLEDGVRLGDVSTEQMAGLVRRAMRSS